MADFAKMSRKFWAVLTGSIHRHHFFRLRADARYAARWVSFPGVLFRCQLRRVGAILLGVRRYLPQTPPRNGCTWAHGCPQNTRSRYPHVLVSKNHRFVAASFAQNQVPGSCRTAVHPPLGTQALPLSPPPGGPPGCARAACARLARVRVQCPFSMPTLTSAS